MAVKKRRNAKLTKEKILDTAEDLFAEKGFHGTSIKGIADKVGVAKATVMHHFRSKKILYSAILRRAFEELNESIGEEGELDVQQFMNGYFRWMIENPRHTRLMMRAQLDNPEQTRSIVRKYYDPLIEQARQSLERAAKNGTIKPVDPAYFVSIFGGAMGNFVICLGLFQNILNKDRKLGKAAFMDKFQDEVNEMINRCLEP